MHRVFFAFTIAVSVYFIVLGRNVYISPFDHPQSNPYVYSHTLLSEIAELHSGKIYLVVKNQEKAINKNQEIARLPGYMGGSGYIFPFLTSMNGYDFSIISSENYCSLSEGSVHLSVLSPEVFSELKTNSSCYKNTTTELASGYGIDAPLAIQDTIFRRFPAEFVLSSYFESINGGFQDLFINDEAWRISGRPWGSVTQGILVSQTIDLTLNINTSKITDRQSWLVFGDHPSRVAKAIDRLTDTLPEISVFRAGTTTSIPATNNTYFVPLNTGSISIRFSEDDFIPAFNGYVLFLHNPRNRQQKRYLN